MTSTGPRRFVPDDAIFARSVQLMEDDRSDMRDMRAAALTLLPTPVAVEECFRMWIPAPDVVAAHNIDEILQSLAGSQPITWKDARPQLRDFVRIPKHGISFVCTSLSTCHALGGLSLKICGFGVKIRKYSLYDKWYYVDLTRLPPDTSDSQIYDWFSTEGARPVLVTPKFQAAGLMSRDRTVFFPQIGCPDALFLDEKTPIREIYFTGEQTSPCFVHHRNRSLNKFTPPSLKKTPKPKRHIELSDMNVAPTADDMNDRLSDNSDMNMDEDRAGPVEPTIPSVQRALPPPRSIIIPRVNAATLSEWKLVDNSKRGLITPGNAKPEPTNLTPCELTVDEGDEHALPYTLAVVPNYYRVLAQEYVDDATSPDIDIEVSRDGVVLNGYTADSPLLPLSTARQLINVRHHQHKVENMSVTDLAKAVDEYLAQDFSSLLSNHEDVLAAIKAQPAYHRRIFDLKDQAQTALIQQHAVFRAFMSTRYDGDLYSFRPRIEQKYGGKCPEMAVIFEDLFPTELERDNAYRYALMDLLLMVMAPSVYLDPVKIQMLIPPQLQPRRLRYSAFLLWSDVTLVYMAQTDVCALFLKHPRIPPHVQDAVKAVKSAMPASFDVVKSSRCCSPRL